MNIFTLTNTLELLRNQEIVDFNLGDVVINDTPVFRMGTIKRNAMPQLKGFPIKGSIAELLEKDKQGKVNISDQFLNWLKREHKIQILNEKVRSDNFSASQSELIASKVAGHIPKLRRDPNHKKFNQVYITDAAYTLLDGQHGWAAVHIHSLLTDRIHTLETCRIMCHIDQLIELARTFTNIIGISAKEGL